MDDVCSVILFSVLALVPTAATSAEEVERVDPLALLQQDTAAGTDSTDSTNQPPITETPAQQIKKFGSQNSLHLLSEGAWLGDLEGSNMIQARAGVGWFFVDNFELDMMLTVDYVDQWGPNAWGGGFDLQLRWHLLAFDDWSFFLEVGGGVLGTTHSVPYDGSPFNFTPNAGFGFTFAVDPTTRLYLGGGWYHISNAGTYANNPGRENLQIWVGLSFQL